MKFESKLGIGEIVLYKPHQRSDSNLPLNELLEVQAVSFVIGGGIDYLCRYPTTGATAWFKEVQLEGDPDFDQENGYKNTEELAK